MAPTSKQRKALVIQKDDDRVEGHEIAAKLMYRDGTRRWEYR